MNARIEYLADHPDFVAQIAAWYFDEWGSQQIDNSLEKTCERIRSKLNKDRAPLSIVAIVDAKPVGAAQLKIREMPAYPNWEFWVGGVYVAPIARGQGLATVLVARLEEISAALGITQLYLQTKDPSGGLYARIGWQPLRQGTPDDARVLIMYKAMQV